MSVWWAVAAGGALGSVLRYGVAVAMRGLGAGLPWWTLLVNVLGSFAIGLFAQLAASRGWPEPLRIGLMTGLLGGFTTFSAFSLETLALLREQPGSALLHVGLHLLLGLSACALGLWLGGRSGSG